MYFDNGKEAVWYDGEPNKRTAKGLSPRRGSPPKKRETDLDLASGYFAMGGMPAVALYILAPQADISNPFSWILLSFFGGLTGASVIGLIYTAIAHIVAPRDYRPVVPLSDLRMQALSEATDLKWQSISQIPASREIVNRYLDRTAGTANQIKQLEDSRPYKDQDRMTPEEEKLRESLQTYATTVAGEIASVWKEQQELYGSGNQHVLDSVIQDLTPALEKPSDNHHSE